MRPAQKKSGITSWLALATLFLVPAIRAAQVKPPTPAAATPGAKPAAPEAAPKPEPAPAPTDPILLAAENLIGKALILRAFPANNNLTYDPAGKLEGTPKQIDWTLAGANILKATRPAPDAVELEGVRVAIRYNPDAHEFQRHPLNDDKMKLYLHLAQGSDSAATVRQLNTAFTAIFSIGIDPALQRTMPPYWRHYFDPTLAWTPDPLAGTAIYPMFGLPGEAKDITPPAPTHKAQSEFTDPAAHDKVKGPVQIRLVVDPEGMPQHMFINRPLGYGLDQRAVEAFSKWRFSPAMRAGKPVAVAIVLNLDFETAPPPPR